MKTRAFPVRALLPLRNPQWQEDQQATFQDLPLSFSERQMRPKENSGRSGKGCVGSLDSRDMLNSRGRVCIPFQLPYGDQQV